MQDTTLIAVDLSKSVFELAVSHHPGQISKLRRLSLNQFCSFIGKQPPSTFVMEACGSAHYWGRELQGRGHTVVLLPAHDVARYRRGNKTDAADAKAILEAYRNKEIHPVPVKSINQQAMTALHRVRTMLVADRTAWINQIRGLLREFGLVIPRGADKVVPQVRAWIGSDAEESIPLPLRAPLTEACERVKSLETAIAGMGTRIAALGAQDPHVALLQTIPGVGPLVSTAAVASVGGVSRFRSGRHLASYLGLTPRERSSGEIRRLGRITKRGDRYLRMLLIHGARAVLAGAKRHKNPDELRRWALRMEKRCGTNTAVVALANRLVRIIWAVWSRHEPYQDMVRRPFPESSTKRAVPAPTGQRRLRRTRSSIAV